MAQRLRFAALVAALSSVAFNGVVLVELIRRHAYGGDQARNMLSGLREQSGGIVSAYAAHGVGHLVDLPVVPLLYLPLTKLSWEAASLTWGIATLAAVVAAWWIAAPRHGLEGALWLAALLGSFPLTFALGQGQTTGLLLLLLAAALRLCRDGRSSWAGVCVAAALQVKPNAVFLVVPALLVAGEMRAFVWALVVTAAFFGLYVVIGGTVFPVAYWHALEGAGVIGAANGSALPLFGGAATGYALHGALAVAVLVAVRLAREPATALALGITGSLLASPYVAGYDLLVLFVAGWTLRGNAKAWFAPGPVIWAIAPFSAAVAAFEALLVVVLTRGGVSAWREDPTARQAAGPGAAPAPRTQSQAG